MFGQCNIRVTGLTRLVSPDAGRSSAAAKAAAVDAVSSLANRLVAVAISPSDHSNVLGLVSPYSSPSLTHLGFSVYVST